VEGEQWDKIREWFVLAEGLGEPLKSDERRKILVLLAETGFNSRGKIRSVFHWSETELDQTFQRLGFHLD
jgi:hypothetical protein